MPDALRPEDHDLLRRCVELAREALDEGDKPFGSLLVDAAGAVRVEDRNRVAGGDATRHPEFEIARWAAAHLTPGERAASVVYTSGEHCPMCSAAHAWVGLGRIVYAASSAQLVAWRAAWDADPSPVAALPIGEVAPGVEVAGPDPALAEEIRALHAQHAACSGAGGRADLEAVRDAYSAMSEQYIGLYADGAWRDQQDHVDLLQRHLTGLDGPVLDLGCGPGHWTGYLHSLGADVTGIDMVPEFIDHARATQDGPRFRLGSMTEVEAAEHSVSGILSWFSTIHLPPAELDRALTEFRRLLEPGGALVVGFFDSDDDIATFDHAVTTAYRWPVDAFAERLRRAGFGIADRRQYQVPHRPDRKYAALAAHSR